MTISSAQKFATSMKRSPGEKPSRLKMISIPVAIDDSGSQFKLTLRRNDTAILVTMNIIRINIFGQYVQGNHCPRGVLNEIAVDQTWKKTPVIPKQEDNKVETRSTTLQDWSLSTNTGRNTVLKKGM
eukprot:CAMPEP_0184745996 /NCGR_PEP_ID=MMETSP0315-20130426/8596_1 /TAXON_ID=101924 /ORGANISM="Rhodosorus marinus, Strain UTEX LB 2760" /LENGTH=126 /DNA_ID=CAMNT_0027218377 /DNA_START=1810 /DNA_END=2190 /DNA_ORIENTATION=-